MVHQFLKITLGAGQPRASYDRTSNSGGQALEIPWGDLPLQSVGKLKMLGQSLEITLKDWPILQGSSDRVSKSGGHSLEISCCLVWRQC